MAFAWKRAHPVGSLKLLPSHRQLIGLAAIDFIVNVAHQVLPSISVLYAGYRYGWNETMAPTGAWFWVRVPVLSLWGIVGPSLLDLMSRRVSKSEQGQLQGANSSSRSIAGLLGPATSARPSPCLLASAADVTWVATATPPDGAHFR